MVDRKKIFVSTGLDKRMTNKYSNKTVVFCETAFRTKTPSATLEYVGHLLGRDKVVPFVERSDWVDDLGIPVFLSYHKDNISGALCWKFPHAGKGLSVEQAQCSAIFEAIERYCAEYTNCYRKDHLLVGSYDTLSLQHHLVSPNLFVFRDDENRVREEIFEWILSLNLGTGTYRYVPANFVFLPYQGIPKVSRVYPSSSSGLASGNTMEEAIVHGIFEVIEKDAFAIEYLSKSTGHDVILDSVMNPCLCNLLELIKERGIRLFIKDITTDFGIYTFKAFLDCTRVNIIPAFSYGSGTHCDPEIAVIRAIVEAFQLRVTQIIQLRYNPEYELAVPTDKHEALRMIPVSSRNVFRRHYTKGAKSVSLAQYEGLRFNDLNSIIAHLVKKAYKVGKEIFAADLTIPEVNVPVTRIIIPGVQPPIGISSINNRHRIETIPELMGWRRL